ncbi:MAG: alpha/beta hydrolase [Planctomycetaceae bacterium]|nr:alpha/beta hydrolase [Planctomycetaceae bacterium]
MASILDHSLVSQRYFFPRADEVSSPLVLRMRDGCNLRCAHLNREFRRTLVHFHGNGETASDWESVLGPFLAECGWSLALVEYRGYGGSSGVPMLATMLSDGEDVVRQLGVAPDSVVAFGRSLGSLYAVELANRIPVAGLVLDSGIHDLEERLRLRVTPDELGVSNEEFETEIKERFDQSRKLRSYQGPTLVLHARDDNLVDVSHAQRNAQACQRSTLRVFERGGHNALYAANRLKYKAELRGFLDGLALDANERKSR